jgi:CRP-like cAMP-binding protein
MATIVSGAARNPLVAKLSHFASLSIEDIRGLKSLCRGEESVEAGIPLLEQGQPPGPGFVLTDGMACRYRLLPDGRRQILTFLIPGDFCEPHMFLVAAMDHSVAALVPSRLAFITRETVSGIMAYHPRLTAAIWWSAIQEAAILRERIVALGRRKAHGRVAYLLCELVWRYRAIGATSDDAIRLPLTQPDLGDTLGLTPVHVNRVLQDFRRDGLILLEHRQLTLLDTASLHKVAEIDDAYLHFAGAPQEVRLYLDRLDREGVDRPFGNRPSR